MSIKNIAVTKEMQSALTPSNVLQDLLDGNNRYTSGSSSS